MGSETGGAPAYVAVYVVGGISCAKVARLRTNCGSPSGEILSLMIPGIKSGARFIEIIVQFNSVFAFTVFRNRSRATLSQVRMLCREVIKRKYLCTQFS